MRFKINKLFIVISILLGLILGAANEFTVYGERFWLGGILAVMGSMGVFGIISAIALVIRGNATNSYARAGKMIGLGFLVLLLFIGSSALFDFIYEQDMDFSIATEQKRDGRYVFLIDDSGSMEWNDPSNERFKAVENQINAFSDKVDFAVYRFANIVACQTPMGSVRPSDYKFDETLPVEVGGGTNIMYSIGEILDEIKDPKEQTTIILLNDGETFDEDALMTNDIIDRCLASNVKVDAIGFGEVDKEYLKNFTEKTGGTYTELGDVKDLSTTMSSVVGFAAEEDSDLLEKHDGIDALHVILRILFLILLALIWTIAKQLFIGDLKYAKKLAVATFIIGAVAAVLFEIMMILPIPGIVARLMLFGAWGCALIPDYLEKKTSGEDLGGFDTGKLKTAYDFGQGTGNSDPNSFI